MRAQRGDLVGTARAQEWMLREWMLRDVVGVVWRTWTLPLAPPSCMLSPMLPPMLPPHISPPISPRGAAIALGALCWKSSPGCLQHGFARWCSNPKPSAPKCQSSHSHTPRSYATKIRSCCWARASVRESVVGCRLLATMLSPTPWARSSARPQSGGRPSCSPMDPPRRGTRRASMSDRASGTPLTPAPQSHSPHAHDARRRWPRRSPQATLSFAARPASS